MKVEAKDILINLKRRLSQIFQVQTQEVITEINKILEIEETPVKAEPKKTVKKVEAPKEITEEEYFKDKDLGKITPATVELTEDEQEAIESINKMNKPTIKELRAEYKEKYGKNAFNGWNEEVLISKLK